MKTTLIICILSLPILSFSQPVVDDISVFSDDNADSVYYFGQIVTVSGIIENISNKVINYNSSFPAEIEKIVDVNNKPVEKRLSPFARYYPNLENSRSKLKENYISTPAGFKKRFSILIDYNIWGNKNLKDLLKIPDSIYENYLTKPLFLLPGRYTATTNIKLEPSTNTLKYGYSFKILPADTIKDYKAFIIAYNNAVRKAGNIDGPDNPANVLLDILINNPTGKYSLTILYLLTNGDSNFNFRTFRDNTNNVFKLFEVFPKITPFNSAVIGEIFIRLNTSKIADFKKQDLINDEKEFINNFLYQIKHLDPSISNTLIEFSKRTLNITGLTNYALKQR